MLFRSIRAAPEPAIPDLPAKNLRIAPPQFRPVVVLPPVVLSAADAPAFIAQAAEPISPPAIPASVANHKPGPLPEIPFEKTEPPAATQPRESHPISEPPITFAEPVRPFMLDGRIPALFGSDSPVALPRLGELLAALPGIKGCILTSRSADAQGGELPAGLDARAVRELSRRMHTALADRAGHVQHLTLEAGHYSLTLFTRGDACVCAVHRARIFLPGVRERFAAVAEELARAL